MTVATTDAYDPDNIFARILRGEIPAHKVYEDDICIAFMDVMPQAEGHTLVVPKAASRNLLDADAVVLAHSIVVAQKIAIAAKSAFAADGISLMQFNEEAGGQSVFHLHIHVIPRYDSKPLAPHSGAMDDGDVLSRNADKLRAALS